MMGRHLIELGLEPGKMFGSILDKAYEAQLEGAISDLTQAWKWLAGEVGLELSATATEKLKRKMGND